jgi:hypothetical protein
MYLNRDLCKSKKGRWKDSGLTKCLGERCDRGKRIATTIDFTIIFPQHVPSRTSKDLGRYSSCHSSSVALISKEQVEKEPGNVNGRRRFGGSLSSSI